MFDIGDVVHLTAAFADFTGVPADPSSVTLTITLPDLTVTSTLTATKVAVGSYSYDYPAVQPGRHLVSWVGSGTNAGAYSDLFDVAPADAGFVIGLTEAKKQLSITTTTNDDELRTWLGATTDVVERYCGDIVPRTYTESYDGGLPTIALLHAPVVSVTSVTEWIGGTGYTLTNQPYGQSTSPYGFTFDAVTGVVTRRSSSSFTQAFTQGCDNVVVTYVAGRSVVPFAVQAAARIILQNLWATRRGGATSIPGAGGQDVSDASGSDYAVPMRAIELMRRYERVQGFA